jgi:cardiolipin synthase
MNVSDVHLQELAGEAAWRDIGVRLTGREVSLFRHAFERTFFRRRNTLPKRFEKHWLVSFNDSFWARWKMNFRIRQRIKHFRQRVWIQNPYVLPPRSLLRALCRHARKGDVTVILPEKNDLPIMRYINHAVLKKLLRRGVRVFEQSGPFAHKKVLIVDNTYTIGSINLNHRSFLHDLEVEVVLTREPTKRALEAAFLADLAGSRQLTLERVECRPLWFRTISRLLFFFRYWC